MDVSIIQNCMVWCVLLSSAHVLNTIYCSFGRWCHLGLCRPSTVHIKKPCLLISPGVFSTGNCQAHAGRFKFSKIQIFVCKLKFYLGQQVVPVLFVLLELIGWLHSLLRKLSNIQVFITTVCLPFVLSSKSDVTEKVASLACNSNNYTVFLETATIL